MTALLSWIDVINDDNERLEFGACHVNMSWRRHKSSNTKYLGLRSAFVDSSHRLPVLLQKVGSNSNAQNHPERGQAVFAAVWSAKSAWAILCDATDATLVPRAALETISPTKERDAVIVDHLRALMENCPDHLRTPLDSTFYERHIS
jgi:hypothetical protein